MDPNINDMKLHDVLCQPLWCNKLFQYKGKCVFFDNWIQSGFKYVVDIVDENGIKPIEWFYDNLRRKRNILCEYKIMSNIFKKLLRHVNFHDLPYQNLRMKLNFEITSMKKSIEITDISSKTMK